MDAYLVDILPAALFIGETFLIKYKAKVDYCEFYLKLLDLAIPFLANSCFHKKDVPRVRLLTELTMAKQQEEKPPLLQLEQKKSEDEHAALQQIKQRLLEMPSSLGRFSTVQHEIKLNPSHTLFERRVKPFRFSILDYELLKKEISSLLREGIIVPSNSPVASPAFFVKKESTKNGLSSTTTLLIKPVSKTTTLYLTQTSSSVSCATKRFSLN